MPPSSGPPDQGAVHTSPLYRWHRLAPVAEGSLELRVRRTKAAAGSQIQRAAGFLPTQQHAGAKDVAAGMGAAVMIGAEFDPADAPDASVSLPLPPRSLPDLPKTKIDCATRIPQLVTRCTFWQEP